MLIASLAGIASAAAHTTRLALGRAELQDSSIVYRLTVSAHDLMVALGEAPDLSLPVPAGDLEARRDAIAAYVTRRLQVSADGAVCAAGRTEADLSGAAEFEEVVLTQRFTCAAAPRSLTIRYLLFFDIDPTHRSVVRVIAPRGPEEYLFDRAVTSLTLTVDGAPAASSGLPFWRVVVLGAEHILAGVDHLLFLAGLLVLPLGISRLVGVVTAFTLAHSVTLALAWYDIVTVPAAWVEIVIALSIAYVAVENMLGIGARRRWAVASLFGLVHGLGFFAVLSDLDLQHTNAVKALVGFNLGVELGQLAVLAVCLAPLLWWWKQPFHRPTAIAASAALLGVALYWAAERAGVV
jgi:hypothetical protein